MTIRTFEECEGKPLYLKVGDRTWRRATTKKERYIAYYDAIVDLEKNN